MAERLPRPTSASSRGPRGSAGSPRPATAPSTPRAVRKVCPTCAYSWLDRYSKNECPKCLSKLVPTFKSPKAFLEYEEALREVSEVTISPRTPVGAGDRLSATLPSYSPRYTPSSSRGSSTVTQRPPTPGRPRAGSSAARSAPAHSASPRNERRLCSDCRSSWVGKAGARGHCPECFGRAGVQVAVTVRADRASPATTPRSHKRLVRFTLPASDLELGRPHRVPSPMALPPKGILKYRQPAKPPTPRASSDVDVLKSLLQQRSSPHTSQAYRSHTRTTVRKSCPHCDFNWLDKHNKNECPKCLKPLVSRRPSGYAAPRRTYATCF